MPSNKEILEAQRYNRRRLITAFSSGIPGGRELESKSPFIPLIVGVVVVAIMLGVGAIISQFSPTLPNGWQNSTLIVVKGTGSRYYTIKGTLRPVTNVTSARLLSESGKYQVSEVSSSTIDGISRGTQIGITGVPDDVPPAGQLHSDLWFSCAIPGKTHTWVAHLPEPRTRRGSVLVKNQDDFFLIADGLRHKIPREQRNKVLLALGMESTTPAEVDAAWLSLFKLGSDLQPLQVQNAGQPVAGMPERLGTVTIGTVIQVDDHGSQRRYVVTGSGKVATLSETADKLHQTEAPLTVSFSDMSSVEVDPAGIAPADWPRRIEDTVPGGSLPCAQLSQSSDGSSVAALYSMTREALVEVLPAPSGTEANAEEKLRSVPTPTTVLGGSGALVRATSGGTLGMVMLVSDLGTLHGLGAQPAESLARLGYTDNDVHVIPAEWTALIPEGTALEPESAWATVGQQ